jgi:lipopolysaccharide heptosyltransferase II
MSNRYDNIKKILFIRLGAIGDVVHTTAAYQTLRQNKKNIDIDYLTSSVMQELLNNDPMIHEVISVTDRTYEGYFRLAQQLNKSQYDLVVNLQPSLKTFFFTTVLNHRGILKYKKLKPGKNENHIHAVENFFNTIQPLIPEVEVPQNLKLYLNKEVVKWAKYKLESEKVSHVIGIIPGVSQARQNKLWPKEHWKALLDYISNQRKLYVIIFGGTNEFELAAELQQVNKNMIRNFCGKLTISQTAAILSLCMLVIGGDTGPSHIATAVGGPKVLGLYGATPPERSGLYGKGHEIITASYDCKFCNKRDCAILTKEGLDYPPCMANISIDSVIAKLGI